MSLGRDGCGAGGEAWIGLVGHCLNDGAWAVTGLMYGTGLRRYQWVRVLVDLVNQGDLVRVVWGMPAWASGRADVGCAVCPLATTSLDYGAGNIVAAISGWVEGLDDDDGGTRLSIWNEGRWAE